MPRYGVFVIGVLLLVVLMACRVGGQTTGAELRNAQGATVAYADLTQTSEGVKIALDASKLPPGSHGLHIHAVGKCETPDFKSAGGHFNPYVKKHGAKSPEGSHAGDLPNLVVKSDGKAKVVVVAKLVTLEAGPNSLLSATGTALVIHADLDDEATDPAGNAGARIACGVITR